MAHQAVAMAQMAKDHQALTEMDHPVLTATDLQDQGVMVHPALHFNYFFFC